MKSSHHEGISHITLQQRGLHVLPFPPGHMTTLVGPLSRWDHGLGSSQWNVGCRSISPPGLAHRDLQHILHVLAHFSSVSWIDPFNSIVRWSLCLPREEFSSVVLLLAGSALAPSAVGPWASYSPYLMLKFLTCKGGIIWTPVPQGWPLGML